MSVRAVSRSEVGQKDPSILMPERPLSWSERVLHRSEGPF